MFKSKLKYIILFLIAANSLAFSQYIGPTPSWVNSISVPEQHYINPKDIKDGYYYILADEQYNFNTHHNYFHYATKVVTEAGLSSVSQIELNFDPSYQKAYFHFIRIHRNGKIIDKSDVSQFKTLVQEPEKEKGILNGKKTFYKNLDDLRKGDVLEYSYSIIGEKSIFNRIVDLTFSFTYSVPIGKITYRVILPASLKVNIKPINNKVAFHSSVITNNGEEITWTIENPPIIHGEDNVPSWYETSAITQISSLNSWNEVKQWGINLFKSTGNSTPLTKNVVSGLTSAFENDTVSKINALIDFVQNDIRYSGNENGIYSHQPHSPEFVIKNRFGDCKDKSSLLTVLLNEIGIKSYPVLIGTGLKDKIINYLPSIKNFDHCIVCISYKGQFHYIDPTITFQKGHFAKRHPGNYKKCMVLDSSKVDFNSIPSDTISRTIFKENFEIIDDSGDAILNTESIYYGSNADYFRYTFSSSSHNELQESFKSYYLKYTDEVEVVDSLKYEDDTINNVFKITEKYLLKKFWAAKEGDKQISQTIIPYALNEKITYVNEAVRKNPLALSYPVNTTHEISLTMSGGWNVEDAYIEKRNNFFDYTYTTASNGNVLKLIYTYKNHVDHVLPKDYKKYKESVDFIDNNMVFTPIQSVLDSESTGFNWPLVLIIIVAILISLYVSFKLYHKSFNYPYIQQYDTIGGWLVIVAIGICFTPILLLIQLVGLFSDDMSTNYFTYLFSSESTAYNPWRGIYVIISHSLNIFLFVSSIFMIFLLFKRKNSFRLYFAVLKIFNAVFLIIDLIVLSQISNENTIEESNMLQKEFTSLTRTIISYGIWVPYVWFSERSKHTFTNGNVFPTDMNEKILETKENVSPNISSEYSIPGNGDNPNT